MRGMKLFNFMYEFFLQEGPHRLYETTDDSFLLLMHVLEVGFHLSLHPFFYNVLNDYNIAPGQLSGFSWWLVMAYFLDCSQCGEVSMLVGFQHLYQLKCHDLGD